MPVKPGQLSHMFENAWIINGMNPVVGQAAPILISSNGGGITHTAVWQGLTGFRVANLIVSIFNPGAGVTLEFDFIESDTAALGTFTRVPGTPTSGVFNPAGPPPQTIYLARFDTQFITKAWIGANFVFGGVGTFDFNSVWVMQDWQNTPPLNGALQSTPLLDINQVTML